MDSNWRSMGLRRCVLIGVLTVGLSPFGWAQSSMSREEAKAAAMVEMLKEQKDQQARQQIDKAKQELRSQRDSSGEHSAAPDWVAQLIVASVVLAVFWFAGGRHIYRALMLGGVKRRLEKMTPEERKQYFAQHPDL